jgi:hypothetical protein
VRKAMPELPLARSVAPGSAARPPVPTARWRVALPKQNNLADLYYLNFYPSDTAEKIFEALRDLYNRDMSTRLSRFIYLSIFHRKIVIETARFEVVSSPLHACRAVTVALLKPCRMLTHFGETD